MHLVVGRTVGSRMGSFGNVIKKVRKFTVKYRQSPKAKSFLYDLYQRRLPGFIDIRWSVLHVSKYPFNPLCQGGLSCFP